MKSSIRRSLLWTAVASLLDPATATINVIDFEDVPLNPMGYNNGSDGTGVITSNGVDFLNSYDATFGSWSGFAVSSTTDSATPGFGNQFSAVTGGGVAGSGSYAVGFASPPSVLELGSVRDLSLGGGAWITNTTYAALSMRDGDPFAKQFGGASGHEADWFLLTIEGFNGMASTGTVEFYLADYRFEDDSLDYIVEEWTYVDFSSLGTIDRMQFALASSDNGIFGMNTPAYFAMDNLVVPEPGTAVLALLGTAFLIRRKR